jgi:hypothetical protein
MSNENDSEFLENVGEKRERKNLRTIMNRGKFDKFELEQFMHGDY